MFHFYIDTAKDAALQEYENKYAKALAKFSVEKAIFNTTVSEAKEIWIQKGSSLRLKRTDEVKDVKQKGKSPNKQKTEGKTS